MDPLVELAIEARALDNRLGKMLTPKQATLCLIAHVGEITPTELAEEMGSATPTVSHAITALINEGLARRVKILDGADGRVKPVTATAYGAIVASELTTILNGVVGPKRAEKAAKALKAIKRANAALAAALD